MNEFYLIIDTSTKQGLVALFRGEECVKEVMLPHGFQNSRTLLPVLDDLFSTLSKKPQDLDFVAVGIGPGSYTGIRVGVVVAKMIHYTCKIPLVGVCSLTAFVPRREGKFVSLLDARVSGVYALEGEKVQDKITWSLQPRAIALEEFSSDPFDILVTPHEKLLDTIATDKPWEVAAPDAGSLAASALANFRSGKVAEDGRVDILYLRRTQAELEQEKEVKDG